MGTIPASASGGGQTKINIWEPMDLGGFMEMQGNERTIGFGNTDRYYGKATRAIRASTNPELGP